MDDIQNDQEPSAQESDTDMEKTEVPAVPSKQNDDQQSNKLPLPFALNFSILMVSQPMVMLAKAISFGLSLFGVGEWVGGVVVLVG